MQTTKKQISEQKTSFKAAIETKKHDLVEGDNSKQCHLPTYDAAVPEGPNWPDVHAYVDDIAVMTRKGSDLLSDLKETFDNLRRFTSSYQQYGEYEALLHGLRIAKEIGIKHIICCGDSDLVAQQVAGTGRQTPSWRLRETRDEIAKCFLGYEVKYVGRDDNTAADMLSKLGSGRKPIPLKSSLSTYEYPREGCKPENPDLAVSRLRK
ncbi:hypothetical protein QYE76_019463 [Lolium multiflorum]|uniref:RNase H type-1 domain-containing protein n=1 Tax=Lolium multiflorum TaxID=4521 RepID=A0AAD8R4K0_LOLMU|nr:hypothetical protein QYE76_019463 [Lolium multiflorum]